ncbi:CHAP domain-containing protein [Nocardia zapadnayensis]|uniref:C40 family peptidase n=1 Tax=Nocardia rhamnosiphila TaxID=426716 RepID=UPI00224652A1|nr:CHAP domain-containing protein [Nocardia zapadnayensis]MCX0274161.1 CHAP domain-containing protein [Nocardia zapadnayensis]
MSPTTVEQLVIDPLPHPEGASGGLNAIIDAVEEHINRSILLLASGNPGSAPDFTEWLEKKGLPGEKDLEKDLGGPKNESAMVKRYTDQQSDARAVKEKLEEENKGINDSQVAAFKLSNKTYKNIDTVVEWLRGRLAAAKPTKYPDGVFRLHPSVEIHLLLCLLNAADRVHEEVEFAANGIDKYARDIDRAAPGVPYGYDRNNSGIPAAANAYRPPMASKASYRPTTDPEAVKKSIDLARGEIGTTEMSAAFASKPYNNGSAWCAAFTSWVWDQAGHDVTWTDFDYVPAVWNDAAAMGLQRTTAQAQPGDLIVFDWEGDGTPDHIGIVESVNGGRIETIEGNSSDQVARRSYPMNSGKVVGVIAPPTKSEVQV